MRLRHVRRKPSLHIRGKELLEEPITRQIPLAGHQDDPFPRQSQHLEQTRHFVDFAKNNIARAETAVPMRLLVAPKRGVAPFTPGVGRDELRFSQPEAGCFQ
jgi:hypothetical protein